ncbi:glutamate-rich protein 3 [Brienomyrus brachyistius]|uniref:glutamate-rich protein 3 n=1 Tax=Brienomyrus brachyistius TaxID=42636 RepID=UPI0020B2DE11|nr:glutamate-rich protein 3 [Brienomyrus brachyistius]
MSHPNGGFLPAYNSLTDKHLAGYFNNTRIRRHLLRVGLITRSGSIVPDKEYKQKLMRKEHQRHMRECLAHAIFHKVLDIERHHQTRIKRRLEDFAQRERVNKIKVERSRRYEEESITVLSPKPPSDPRNGYAPHSGPEMEPSESSESFGSSRPNTAPGKMQRPVRLQPISNGTSAPTRRPSRSIRRSHAAVEDTEQLACCTLDRDMLRRAAVGRFSSGISPYRLPVINNFITPVPPPPPPKGTGRSIKGTPSGTVRGRKLRPTTAPSVPMESRFQKTSTHSNVSVTMVYFGKSVHLSHDDVELRDEVKVFQQHCGGENICVYRGKLMEGECFRFVSRRHCGFPFSLTFFLNGMQVERLSSCCEFRHRGGSRLGGKHGHFGFTGVAGASPCYRCIIAMGLDKKPTPPPKRTKGDSETDGFMAASSEMVRDEDEFRSSRSCECENIPANREQRDDQSKSTWGGVQNDYEEDFEGEDEKAEEGEPRSDHHSDGEEGCPESPGAGNSAYTDSEAEEDHPREKRSLSRSSRSATFSSRASKDDSGSDTEEVKESIDEARVSLASCAVSKAELQEEDGSLDLEEHVRVNGGGAASLPGDETHHPSVGESMDSRSTGDAENMTEIQTVTTAAEAETTDWECCQDAMERDGLEDPPTGSHTVTEGAAPDEEEVQQVELEREPNVCCLTQAKSVQEKLAEAIMKEAHCSSEPELSDTSTDEEEESSSVPRRTPDQNLMDTELSAALSLPWTLCTKAPKDQEASAESPEAAAPPTEQAGCEAPVKQDTDGNRTGSHSDPEDGDGLEPLQEAEDPLPDAEVGGEGPDETKKKMETLDSETAEWEQNETQEMPGEAQSPHLESKVLAVAEEESCERECDAEDDKSVGDQVENEAEELIETDEKKHGIITEECNASDRGGEPEDKAEDDGPTERDEGQVTLAEGEIAAESSVVSRESCGGEEATTTQEQATVEVREDGQTETTEQDITETAEGGGEEDKGTAEKPRTMEAGNEHDDQEDGNIMKGEADEAKCGAAETEIVKDEETNDELRGNMEIEEGGSEVIGADNEEEIMEEVSSNGTQEVQPSTTSNTDVVEATNEENGEAEDERVLKGAGLDGAEGDSELRTEDTEECNRETKLDSEGRGDTEAEGQVDQNPSEQDENKESNSTEEEDVKKPEDLENSNDADREIAEEKSNVQGEQLEGDHGEVLLEADHATDSGGDTRDDEEVIESGVECESAEQVRPEMEKEVSSRKTEGTKSPTEESLNDAEEPEQAEAAELDVKQATQDDSDQPEEERDTDPDKMADLDMDPKPADIARAEHEVSMAEGMVDEIKGHELAMSEGLATTTKTMEFHGQQADEAVDLTAEDMITKEWKDTDSSEEEKGDQMGETMNNYHATQSQADDQLVTFQNKRSQPMIGPDEEEISTAASGDGRNLDTRGRDSETEPGQSEITVDTDLPSPEESVAQLESKDEESGEHRASQGTSDVEADVGSGPESEARSSHTVSSSPTSAHGGYRPMVARGGWNAQPFPLNVQQAKGQLKYIQAIPVKASSPNAAPSGEPQHTGAEVFTGFPPRRS